MEPNIDAFLPFDWITAHPLQRAWTNEEIHFNDPECVKRCTRYEASPYSLTWDQSVTTDPNARIIGYLAEAVEGDPLKAIPMEFRQYLGIIGKEVADALPEHRPYDHKINLKEGETAPWGPIYPLSEVELQTL